jgi:hypothetical protein
VNNLLKAAWFCLVAGATAGCDPGAKPGVFARREAPLEIRGYSLGMSERAVLQHGTNSCYTPPGKLDADRICSVSTNVAAQPAIMFFYFYGDTLEKLALTILPDHGHLSEVNRIFAEEFETKYGKPSTDNSLSVIWSRGGGAIAINRGDGRTMTVNLVSDAYESEKTRRTKAAGRGIEI